MTAVGPLDAMFLLVESRKQPMHVGGLMVFEAPAGAGRDYVAGLFRDMMARSAVHPTFRQVIRHRASGLGYWFWEPTDDFAVAHHVRLSTLARPGRVEELFELTSQVHGVRLDRHRPLWELHLIDGLRDNRFGLYIKVHHAMFDGVTALRWMQSALDTDPDRLDMPAPYALPARTEPLSDAGGSGDTTLTGVARTAASAAHRVAGSAGRGVADLAGLGPVAVRNMLHALCAEHQAVAFQAPRSIFNTSITGARRFAATSWPIERLATVRAATGATLNDVMLAICAGALRRYLLELNALPVRGLTAMVPVSLRGDAAQEQPGGANSLATLLCDLATDEPDPAVRIRRIHNSMAYGKAMLAELTPLQKLLLGASGIAAAGFGALVPGLANHMPPPYNLVISNVPGPLNQTLYWNRSKLVHTFPASVVLNGQALNISVTTYNNQLHIGLIACRRTVPHLQRLLNHLDASLTELENV